MIEEIVLNYLKENLEIPAYMEEPEKPPKEYVLVEKIGSSESDMVCTATLVVQSYSDSLYHTAILNNKVKETMQDIVNIDDVSRCACNSDYNYTDTTTKRYRYQAVFDIVY